MYGVQEFSEMTGLSKGTLRYYADIKLLEPAEINPVNGYKRYDNGSYLIAMVLIQLKRFRFSIQEMKSVIEDESFGDFERLLLKKRARIAKEVQELQDILRDIDASFEKEKEEE